MDLFLARLTHHAACAKVDIQPETLQVLNIPSYPFAIDVIRLASETRTLEYEYQ